MRFGATIRALGLSFLLASTSVLPSAAQRRPAAPQQQTYKDFTVIWDESVRKSDMEKDRSRAGPFRSKFIRSFYEQLDQILPKRGAITLNRLTNSIRTAFENATNGLSTEYVAAVKLYPMLVLRRDGPNDFADINQVYIGSDKPNAVTDINKLLRKPEASGVYVRVEFKRANIQYKNDQISVIEATKETVSHWDLLELARPNRTGVIDPRTSVKRTERGFDLDIK